jgi:hypothetical protein
LDPYALWGAALSLTLLAGWCCWAARRFTSGSPTCCARTRGWRRWSVPRVQTAGAALLLRRLDGIAGFPAAESLAGGLLTMSAAIALVAGGATLATQRRPERRVGTLASLQGALLLCAVVAGRADAALLSSWGAHMALALTGAGALARLLTVSGDAAGAPPALFRRHPLSGAVGLYALFSLAGVPGTPGMALWLDAARALAATRHPALLVALVFAWIVAFTVVAGEARRAFAAPTDLAAPERSVPWTTRAALWCAAAGLAGMLAAAALPEGLALLR